MNVNALRASTPDIFLKNIMAVSIFASTYLMQLRRICMDSFRLMEPSEVECS